MAHRDEPGRRLYGRGDVLVLDIGADLGLETGQNLVVRRRFFTGDRGMKPTSAGSGEQTAGLIQVVEAGDDSSVAIVVYACGELFAGDTVEPFDALPMWTAQGLRTPQYDDPAHVILGEHGQTLGAPRQLMVIDRGAAQGAERGQRLTSSAARSASAARSSRSPTRSSSRCAPSRRRSASSAPATP